MSIFGSRILRFLLICTPYLLIAYIYRESLSFGYVWDDKMFIRGTDFLDRNALISFVTKPFSLSDNYYRPLVLLSFSAQSALGLDNVFFYHLFNVVVFFALCAVVHAISRNQLIKHGVAVDKALFYSTLFACIFATHTANVEAVAWLSGRFDLFVAILVSPVIYIATNDHCTKVRHYFVAFLSMLLAAFAKESAVAVFPIVGLMWLISDQNRRRHLTRLIVSLVVAGCVYLAVRYAMLGVLPVAGAGGAPRALSFIASNSLNSLSIYIVNAVLPWIWPSPAHDYLAPIPIHVRFIALFALVLLVVHFLRQRNLAAVVYLVVPAVALLPVLHFLPIAMGGRIASDRFMLVSLLVMCSVSLPYLTSGLGKMATKLVPGFLIVWIVIATPVTKSYVDIWATDVLLFNEILKSTPDSWTAKLNYADALVAVDDCKNGLRHADEGFTLSKGAVPAVNYATVYYKCAQYETAVRILLASIVKPSGDVLTDNYNWYLVADSFAEMGHLAESTEFLRRTKGDGAKAPVNRRLKGIAAKCGLPSIDIEIKNLPLSCSRPVTIPSRLALLDALRSAPK